MTYILLIDDNAALANPDIRRRGEVASHAPFAVSGNLALLREAEPPAPDPVILYLVLPDQDGAPANGQGLVNRVDRTGALRPLHEDDGGEVTPEQRRGEDDELGVPRLLARLEALLRQATKGTRVEPAAREILGDVEVNLDARSVARRGEPVDLAPVEFDLLAVLIRHRGHVVSRRQLVREVWQDRVAVTSRTLDKHIYKLRRKLENNPANPRYLRTVTGAGYRLEP